MEKTEKRELAKWVVIKNESSSDYLKCNVFHNDIFKYQTNIKKDKSTLNANIGSVILQGYAEYNINSPDGIFISRDSFLTHKEAIAYMYKWIENFKAQGYYSSNYLRIPIHMIEHYCRSVMYYDFFE